MLEQIAIFLAAAVILVPLFKRLGLGTVLGYLIAGMLIGPWGLGLVGDVENTLHFSELGVVLLLFIIGLELQPSRLWVLRRTVFGLGSAQLLLSALPIALLAAAMGQPWLAAVVIGVGAGLSSTAFVLQTLAERGELTTRHGREAFAVLLFQDLAVIPVLAIVPLLAVGPELSEQGVDWVGIMRALAVIVTLVVVGRELLRWVFRAVARFGTREIFTAAALLAVIGAALLMHALGLSMSLGAFLAGVLLADSEFRHEIEAELEPFKGLLLGLFFIAVGMSVNLGLVEEQGLLLIGLATALILIKFAVLYLIGRLAGCGGGTARNLGIALAAGGEFAFVLFGLARDYRIVAAETAETLVMAITLSMMFAPVLFLINDKVLKRWAARHEEPEYDRIDEPANPVIIAGFGRFRPDHRAHPAHAWHRVHGARDQSAPGRLRAPVRQQDLLRRCLAPGAAARGQGREHEALRARHRRHRDLRQDREPAAQALPACSHLRAGAQPLSLPQAHGSRRRGAVSRYLSLQPGDGARGTLRIRGSASGGRTNGEDVPRPRRGPVEAAARDLPR